MTVTRPIRLALSIFVILILPDLTAGFVKLGMGSAAAPQDVQSLKDALELHDAAYDGDQSALRPAIMALRRLRREDPWDAESAVYLGSAYAIAVHDGRFGPSQLVNFARAVHRLNAAVEFAPDNFEVRMVRATILSHMPRIFGRRGTAIEDMLALHRIFSGLDAPSEQIATAMIPIYERLLSDAPERGDWISWIEHANQGTD